MSLTKVTYSMIDGETVNVQDYGAVGNGVTDDTAAIQAALNSGVIMVRAPAAKYVITSPITIPVGVKLFGDFAGHESSYKGDSTQAFNNTTFIMRGTAQFRLSDNSAFEGATLWYDQQNYNLSYNVLQPDGIDPWVSYPPGFEYIGNYSSVTVEKVVFLGGTRFFYSGYSNTIEKLLINEIYGFPLEVGVEIKLATDMTYIQNVHWNPNAMYRLPNYTPTVEKTAKYVRNTVPFKLGRVDGGWLTNCFAYAIRDFVWFTFDNLHAGGVGGSIRLTNCAADVCHNFIRIEQTQRGFGIGAVNCWAVNNVFDIYDPVAGSVVTRPPAMVRFGDDAPVFPDPLRLENAHVELVAVKRSPGRAVPGIPGTGTPLNLFYFDSTGADLSINCSACDFDEVTSGIVVGSDLDSGERRYVAMSVCGVRANQNNPQTYYNHIFASQNNSYSAISDFATGYVGGSALTGQFVRRARDFAEANFMGVEALYKDGGGNQKVFSAYRETGGGVTKERLIEVDRATGDICFTVMQWNQNRLRLGAYYLWVDSTGDLRIKNSAPTSDTDGTVVGTQT